jgi:RNA polymerase sigma-70 factor (ECF subfamily)
VRWCLVRNQPGPYQLQTAIGAVHADAARAVQTDWSQILALYDHLIEMAPMPVVALNRAVAIGEVLGPAAAIAQVDRLDLNPLLPVSRHAGGSAVAAWTSERGRRSVYWSAARASAA